MEPPRALPITSQTATPARLTIAVTQPWITVAPENGTTPVNATVSVNPTGLPVGTYIGGIKISSPPFAAITIPVMLTVANPAGKIVLDPAGPSELEGRVGDLTPMARTIRVFTDGEPAGFSVKTSVPWLTATPTFGTAGAFSPATIQLGVDPSGLVIGQKTAATVTVTSTATPPSTVATNVNVTLQPGMAALHSVWPESLNVAQQDGVLTFRGAEFYGALTSVTLNKTAAKLTVLSPTVATLTVPASLLAKPGAIEIAIKNLAKDAPVVHRLPVLAPTPSLQTVLNAASFELPADGSAPLVSSGELVSIFGSHLGPERALVATPSRKGEYATTLGATRVQVKVNGAWVAAVPMAAYKTQVNALLPFALPLGMTELQVESDGVMSEPIPIEVVPATPGIFTMDSSGEGHASVVNYTRFGGYAGVNSPVRPAKVGEYISIYATGCGELTPSTALASLVDASKSLPAVAEQVEVLFDNVLVRAAWAGAVPGMTPGLCQVNVQVPDIPHARRDVPIRLFIHGRVSGPETVMAVSN